MKATMITLAFIEPVTVLAIAYLAVLGLIVFFLYKTVQYAKVVKEQAIQDHPHIQASLHNMYTEARYINSQIARCETYDAYCEAEERVDKFADCYRELPGFEDVIPGLNDLLQKRREYVRKWDKARPFDFQYTAE